MSFATRKRTAAMTLTASALALSAMFLGTTYGKAAYQQGTPGNDVLIGRDDDNIDNPGFHPEGTAADQSLKRADILIGGEGDDLLIGLLGDDYLDGGEGDDILIGGTEQGTQPNSDIQLGGPGWDVAVWAGGDGSDAFIGGPNVDAIVFAVIDRDANNVPTVQMADVGRGERPISTSNLTGAPGFCRIDPAPEGSGYDKLVRFIVRATGALAVTVRVRGVEQVFCASEAGGSAVFADLTDNGGGYGYGNADTFVPVSLDDIRNLNPLVGAMVR